MLDKVALEASDHPGFFQGELWDLLSICTAS